MVKFLAELVALLEKITWGRAILWGFTVLISIALFNVYETRQASVPALFANTLVIAIFGASAIIGFVSWAGIFLMRRVDQKADEVTKYLKDRILSLENGLAESRIAEAACDAKLETVQKRLAKAERILSQNNLQLDETR